MSYDPRKPARPQWDSLVNKLKETYPPARAVSMAVKQNPELHRAMLEEVNPGHKFG